MGQSQLYKKLKSPDLTGARPDLPERTARSSRSTAAMRFTSCDYVYHENKVSAIRCFTHAEGTSGGWDDDGSGQVNSRKKTRKTL
jgi:hypothetical protein